MILLERAVLRAQIGSATSSAAHSLFSALFLAAVLAQTAYGQEPPETTLSTPTSPQELAKEALNPFSQYIKIPLQFVTGFRVGPENRTGESASIEPVIPIPVGSTWNIIIQPLLSMEYLPSPDATTGLNDFEVSVFLTPEKTGSWIWGLGPIFEMPTATNAQLGSGKWSAGPTGAIIYSQGPWLNGVLVSQLLSFAGDSQRARVNLTSIELQASYTFDSGWYVQSNPTISYDWTGSAWTVPVGADVGKALTVGGQDVTLQAGAYDLVERPGGDPEWIMRISLTLLFPTGEQ